MIGACWLRQKQSLQQLVAPVLLACPFHRLGGNFACCPIVPRFTLSFAKLTCVLPVLMQDVHIDTKMATIVYTTGEVETLNLEEIARDMHMSIIN